MSWAGGGAAFAPSSSLSSPPGIMRRRFSPPSPDMVLSSTIQCTDLAKSKSFVEQPFSPPLGKGTASGNWILLKMSIIRSTTTKGPRKQTGGGSRAHNAASAGGCGNVPPLNGCSPGYAFAFGLNGIICEKSGLGNCEEVSASSMGTFLLLATTPLDWKRDLVNCYERNIELLSYIRVADGFQFNGRTGIEVQEFVTVHQLGCLLALELFQLEGRRERLSSSIQ